MRETFQKPQTEIPTDIPEERVLGERTTDLTGKTRRRLIGMGAALGVAAAGSFLGLKIGMGSVEAGAEAPQGQTETSQDLYDQDPMMSESYLTYDFQGLEGGYTTFENFEAEHQLQEGEYGQQFFDTLKMVANYQPTTEEYELWEQHAENLALINGEQYQEGDGVRMFGRDFLTPLMKATYAIDRDIPGIAEVYPTDEFFDEFVGSFVTRSQYNQYITRSRGMEPVYQVEDIELLSESYHTYDMSVYSEQATILIHTKDNAHLNSMSTAYPYHEFLIDAAHDEETGKFGIREIRAVEMNIGQVEEKLGYRPDAE